jgi:hypothetical protein
MTICSQDQHANPSAKFCLVVAYKLTSSKYKTDKTRVVALGVYKA